MLNKLQNLTVLKLGLSIEQSIHYFWLLVFIKPVKFCGTSVVNSSRSINVIFTYFLYT